MQLIEVNSQKLEKEWVLFPVNLYRNDPSYIRPIDREVMDVFDPKVNIFYSYDGSETIRWLLR